jgi:hypothetical protein
VGVVAFLAAMLALHTPRVEAFFEKALPAMTEDEAKAFPIPELRHLRAVYVADELAKWQRRHWARLERAEAIARAHHIGPEGMRRAFNRLDAPNLPIVYDAADMLDLPRDGTEGDPIRIRELLGPWVSVEPDPVPPGAILREMKRESMFIPGR